MFAARLVRDLPNVGIVAEQVAVPSVLSRMAYRLTAGSDSHVTVSAAYEGSWLRARARLRLSNCIYVKNDPLDLSVAHLLAPDKPKVIGIHSSLDIPRVDWRTGLRRAARQSVLYRRLLIGRKRLYHCLYAPPPSWGLPPAQIRVIPHPVDHDRPPVRAASPQQRLVFVGRLNKDKGADLLPGLAKRLRRDLEMELIVVGDGEFAPQMRSEFGVDYFPYSNDVAGVLRSATWLVMPSRWEQQPLVLLEALGAHLPYVLGPAQEIQRFGLAQELVMSTDSIDALHRCCLEAIRRGRSHEKYGRLVDQVATLADSWPSARDTVLAMASVLREAAGLAA